MDSHAFNPAPAWLRVAERILDGLAGLFLGVAGGLLVVMLAINLVNIILRNTGVGALLWVQPWTGVLMVWAVFLAFYVMYRRGLDIALTFFLNRCQPGAQRALRGLANLCGLIVVVVLVLELPQILARQRGTMELVGLTRYWLSLPLVGSAALLVPHFLLDSLAVLKGWHVATPPSEAETLQW